MASYNPDSFRINSRRAEEIAGDQQAQRAQALLGKTGTATQLQYAPGTPRQPTDAEKAAGIYAYSADPTLVGAKQITTHGPLTTQDNQQNLRNDLLTQAGSGVMTPADRAAQGNNSIIGPGQILQQRNERLAREGATPQQIATNHQNLQGIMNAPKPLDQRLTEVQPVRTPDGQIDYAATEAQKQTVIAQHKVEQEQYDRQQQAAYDKQKAKEAPTVPQNQPASATPSIPTVPATTPPAVASLKSALAGLTPEDQAILGPVIDQIQTDATNGQAKNDAVTNALLNGGTVDGTNVTGINPMFSDIKTQLEGMKTDLKTSNDTLQSFAQEIRDNNQKYLDEQLGAQQQALTWQENQQEVTLARQKDQTHQSLVAQLALSGGFGQDAALREVRASDTAYDQKIQDLRTELGIAKTDLSAKFTGMYIENSNNYLTSSLQNFKDLRDGLQKIGMNKISSLEAKVTAEQSLVSKHWEVEQSLQKDKAAGILSIAKDMQTEINSSRDDKRAQEQLGWQRLEWVSQTYGSNAPQVLLDSIGKQLPGVDVKGVAGQMTLAEMKKKGGGGLGSGSSSGFSLPSKPDGNALSYDDFVAQKRAALKADTNMTLEEAQKQLDPKHLKDEYEARLKETTQYDPAQLQKDYQVRRLQIDQASNRADTDKAFKSAIDNKDYNQAYRIVYSTGKDIPPADLTQLDQVKMARSILPQLDATLRTLAASGQAGPGIGKTVKTFDPWNQNMTDLEGELLIMSRSYGRGVLAEKGRLAYQEMQALKKGMADETFTPAQAISSLHKMSGYIDTALTDFVQTRKSAGMNVADTQADIEDLRRTNPLGADAIVKNPFEAKKASFLNSLPK